MPGTWSNRRSGRSLPLNCVLKNTNLREVEVNSIHAYDDLAGRYDEQLQKDGGDLVRATVHRMLKPYLLASMNVLDFGGGTGLDLELLAGDNRTVYFCEPSAQMRSLAKKRAEELSGNISFMQDCDVWNWHDSIFNRARIDFCLANFGVVNSIVDLDLFFEKIGLAIKSGGILALVILDEFPGNSGFFRWARVFYGKIRMRILQRTYVVNGPIHKPVVHTRKRIRTSARAHFSSVKEAHVKNSMFRAYVFRKN